MALPLIQRSPFNNLLNKLLFSIDLFLCLKRSKSFGFSRVPVKLPAVDDTKRFLTRRLGAVSLVKLYFQIFQTSDPKI